MRFNKIAMLCFTFVMMVIVSACGTNSASTSDKENKEDSAKTRIYKSDKGDIELPANPKRVVVADQDYVGEVLTLGVKPVGASGWIFETPYYKDQLKGVESVGDKTSISIEKVAGLKPDVILTYNEEYYEQLSKIAPTVLLPFGKYDYRERLTKIGEILNKKEEAKKALAAFDEKVKTKKSELFQKIDKNEKVALVELSDKQIYLFGKNYGRGGEIIYNEFGLHAPAKVEEAAFKTGWAEISLEALPEYLGEADHIFLGVRGANVGAKNDEARKKEIMSLKVWKDLPAVKAGNVHLYDVQTLYFQDIMALDNQIDFVSESLTANSK